ncbi:MAG: hypothetical protein AAFV95_28795 [Bacteroidota bacterium]
MPLSSKKNTAPLPGNIEDPVYNKLYDALPSTYDIMHAVTAVSENVREQMRNATSGLVQWKLAFDSALSQSHAQAAIVFAHMYQSTKRSLEMTARLKDQDFERKLKLFSKLSHGLDQTQRRQSVDAASPFDHVTMQTPQTVVQQTSVTDAIPRHTIDETLEYGTAHVIRDLTDDEVKTPEFLRDQEPLSTSVEQRDRSTPAVSENLHQPDTRFHPSQSLAHRNLLSHTDESTESEMLTPTKPLSPTTIAATELPSFEVADRLLTPEALQPRHTKDATSMLPARTSLPQLQEVSSGSSPNPPRIELGDSDVTGGHSGEQQDSGNRDDQLNGGNNVGGNDNGNGGNNNGNGGDGNGGGGDGGDDGGGDDGDDGGSDDGDDDEVPQLPNNGNRDLANLVEVVEQIRDDLFNAHGDQLARYEVLINNIVYGHHINIASNQRSTEALNSIANEVQRQGQYVRSQNEQTTNVLTSLNNIVKELNDNATETKSVLRVQGFCGRGNLKPFKSSDCEKRIAEYFKDAVFNVNLDIRLQIRKLLQGTMIPVIFINHIMSKRLTWLSFITGSAEADQDILAFIAQLQDNNSDFNYRANVLNEPATHMWNGTDIIEVGSFFRNQVEQYEDRLISAAETDDRHSKYHIRDWYNPKSSGCHPEQCPNRAQWEQIMVTLAYAIDLLIRNLRDDNANNNKYELDNLISRLDELRDKNLKHQHLAALLDLLHQQFSPSTIPVIRALRRAWDIGSGCVLEMGDNPVFYMQYMCSIMVTMRYYCSAGSPDYITSEDLLNKIKKAFKLLYAPELIMSPDITHYHRVLIKLTMAQDPLVSFSLDGIPVPFAPSSRRYIWSDYQTIERLLIRLQQSLTVDPGKVPSKWQPFNCESKDFYKRIRSINMAVDKPAHSDGSSTHQLSPMFNFQRTPNVAQKDNHVALQSLIATDKKDSSTDESALATGKLTDRNAPSTYDNTPSYQPAIFNKKVQFGQVPPSSSAADKLVHPEIKKAVQTPRTGAPRKFDKLEPYLFEQLRKSVLSYAKLKEGDTAFADKIQGEMAELQKMNAHFSIDTANLVDSSHDDSTVIEATEAAPTDDMGFLDLDMSDPSDCSKLLTLNY